MFFGNPFAYLKTNSNPGGSMKILNDLRVNPEQTDALQKQKAGAEAFGDILAQEIKQAQGVTSDSSLVASQQNMAVNLGMLDSASPQLSEALALSLQEASLQVEGLFSDMESYATQLRSDGMGSLREAYTMLQNMSESISRLKENSPGLSQSPELAALVNELDVLTTTEMFKFNRGDYL